MADERIANALNRMPKESLPTSGGPWKLLYFMGMVFLVFLLTYIGLAFGYSNFLKARIATTTKNIEALVAEDPTAGKQEEFLAFQAQLINLKGVLDKHGSTTKVLKLLEAHTNSRIQYTGLNFSFADKKVEVQGIAPSFEILAEQLQAYATTKEIVRQELGNSRVKEGGAVNFTVVLYLSPSFQ
jgi:hypothetical protein